MTPKKVITPPDPKKLAKVLIRASHAAGKVLMKHYRKKLTLTEKPGAGLVSNADIAAEKVALKILRQARPDFGILTEESPAEISPGAGRFILDPLDGTTNFIHGFPMFCVSVAAEWDGQIVAGVIFHPTMAETYVATLGGGAFVNGKRMRVSRTATLRDSLLTTGFTYRKDEWLREEMEAFERLSAIARAVRRPGSAALDLAYVARGSFDAFWERRLSPWDVAAGSLLVQEAGGKVTDFQGKPFRVEAPAVLATNAELHDSLLRTVAPESCPI